MTKDKTVIKLIEEITLISKNCECDKKVLAKIDTGASKSSIDTKLASEIRLGPIVMTKLVKSAHGNSLRPVVEAKIKLAGKEINTQFTLADRKHMKYPVLIGINTIRGKDFLVDPNE